MTDPSQTLQSIIDDHAGQLMDAPIAYYQNAFAKADPEAIAARTGVQATTDGATTTFHLTLMQRPVSVLWPELTATFDDEHANVSDKELILLADFLLHGQNVPATGKYLAYTEVPGGNHYFKAFEGRCLMRLAYMFKNSGQFAQTAEAAGGVQIAGNATTYEFQVLESVSVRLTFWDGDDEFPPSSQILFSDNVLLALTAEDLAAVGDIVLNVLKSYRG